MTTALSTVFIPALLCDERLYSKVITELGDQIDAHVLMSPKPDLADSVADILRRAPATFVLVGTSYGGNLAMEVALAAPERITALWLMGCDASGPREGGPDLSAGLRATPDAVIGMLSGRVVHKQATGPAAIFTAMANSVGGDAGAAQATALGKRADITARLSELSMPVLALWGQDDALVPATVGARLAAALPKCHFEQLANCGHLPTLEKPEESAALFAAFLRRQLN